MKTILTAMDFSDRAVHAAAYAAALAKETKAKLVLYHALDLSSPISRNYPIVEESISSLQEENEQRLSRMATELRERYGIPVEYVQTNELFLDGFEKEARKHEDVLLVMGIRSDSVVQKIFGSVTIQAIRESHFPLLIIPEKARYNNIERILLAWEYDKLTQEADLNPLLSLARKTGAEVMILHVENTREEAKEAQPPKEARPRLEAIFHDIKHSYTYIQKREVIAGLESGISATNASMVVMFPHHKGLVDALLHFSQTKKMALHTHIPLLVLPLVKKENSLAASAQDEDKQEVL